MFNQARLKLTAWYLAIIMLISILFSSAMYGILTHEVQRAVGFQRARLERNLPEGPRLPQNNIPRFPGPGRLDPDLIQEVQTRMLVTLIAINSFILIASGLLGYFLAGRTLKPIKNMVDEQNQFITDASHELRTPLTALKTSMEVFLKDNKSGIKDARALIKDGIRDVDNLKALSDSLLQLAQFQQPGIKFAALDIFDVVTNAVDRVKVLANQKTINVVNNVKHTTIKGSKHSLTDLIVILLENSIKYSQSNKKIQIDSGVPDHQLVLTVEDQGIGIEAKDLPHIFDRFYRAGTSRSKDTVSGYGLGLAIAKKIVETHRGSISVNSAVGKGTIVSVKLPFS